MSTFYKPTALVVGKRYRVQIADCCISGCFVATLASKEGEVVSFDNGVILEVHGTETAFEETED